MIWCSSVTSGKLFLRGSSVKMEKIYTRDDEHVTHGQ